MTHTEQGAQSAVLHAYQPRLDGSREGTCSVCLRPRHPDWPDYIASLEAAVAQQAETIRGLREHSERTRLTATRHIEDAIKLLGPRPERVHLVAALAAYDGQAQQQQQQAGQQQ